MATRTDTARPTLAVFTFASCDGCQLTLLNCEDELLTLAGRIRIANFAEATRATVRGPYDVCLVEGSITTPDDARRVTAIRKAARYLITIGACATSGGIQALRNFADVDEYRSVVYPHPDYIATLDRSTAIASHVRVDFELRGCPVDKGQLLEVLAAYLQGRRPRIPEYSVCVECKRRGTVCLAVSRGVRCLGPVTQAGCGALCPRFSRGCFGCFGPAGPAPNTSALADRWRAAGASGRDVVRAFRGVTAGAEPFRRESTRQETLKDTPRDTRQDTRQEAGETR